MTRPEWTGHGGAMAVPGGGVFSSELNPRALGQAGGMYGLEVQRAGRSGFLRVLVE